VHQVGENAGHAQVTMLLAKEHEDWNVRVVAVDTNGVEHTANRGMGTPADLTTVWTYDFQNVPFAATREFQVQVRSMYWVEFRDVALAPRDRAAVGKSSRPLKPSAFSETREVQITELFDFDKGTHGEFPIAADGRKVYAGTERNPSWSVNHGFDVDAGTNGLSLLQLRISDVTSNEWGTLTVTQVVERLTRHYYGPERLPIAGDGGPKLPSFHAFRTRDHGMGLLQINAVDPTRTNVTVRYKFIERAHFE
jgi:hypothetical protein